MHIHQNQDYQHHSPSKHEIASGRPQLVDIYSIRIWPQYHSLLFSLLNKEDVLDVYSIDLALAGTFRPLDYNLVSPEPLLACRRSLTIELRTFRMFCPSHQTLTHVHCTCARVVHTLVCTRVHSIFGYITFERHCSSITDIVCCI